MSDTKEKLIESLENLHWYYSNYRYSHNHEFHLSVEYADTESVDEKFEQLKYFIIDKPFDLEIFCGLTLEEQEFLHYLVELLKTVEDLTLDENCRLISVKIPSFLCDYQTIFAAYDYLLENEIDDFVERYPKLSIANMAIEIDNIYLLLQCIDDFFDTICCCAEEQVSQADSELCLVE